MPTVEIQLSDDVEAEIHQLVESGDFLNRDQAHEELLSMGISVYGIEEESEQTLGQDIADQTFDEQGDPAMRDDSDADPTF